MENFNNVYNKWRDINADLFNAGIDYLKRILDKLPNNEVILDTQDADECACCTYDGGNHPEYDANPYSQVERVYIKDGDVLLDTEDANEYPIDGLSANEVAYIVLAVDCAISKNYDLDG